MQTYEKLKQELDGDYPFEILRGKASRKEEPTLGPDIVASILHHEDGHIGLRSFDHILKETNAKDIQ